MFHFLLVILSLGIIILGFKCSPTPSHDAVVIGLACYCAMIARILQSEFHRNDGHSKRGHTVGKNQ